MRASELRAWMMAFVVLMGILIGLTAEVRWRETARASTDPCPPGTCWKVIDLDRKLFGCCGCGRVFLCEDERLLEMLRLKREDQ